MGAKNSGGSFWRTVKQLLVKIANAIPPLHSFLNRKLINKYAYAAAPRPRPLTMAAAYPTWRGLTDRRYSGRHLPPTPDDAPEPPNLSKVLKLFERTKDCRATDTSLLFPFFAQWFTDSFLRTKWKDPSKQDFAENESNHEIDLCQIYGVGETQTDMLREGSGGRLKSQRIDGEEYPASLFEKIDGGVAIKTEFEGLYTTDNLNRVFDGASDEHKLNCFAVGLEHGNSTIGNTLMNTLFLREHNRIAGVLQAAHPDDPDWDDERLFQTARNVAIVLLLKIVISDYIVHIAPLEFRLEAVPGMAERESWYRTNWIAVEFALLYRWHDLIPATVWFGNSGEQDSAKLRRNNAWLLDEGVDRVLLDASRQLAGRTGLGNTAAFLLHLRERSMTMARTCRLQPFNAYRRHYGLDPVRSFEALTGDREKAAALRALYGDIDKLEWFVGIFAEDFGPDEIMGELLNTMVANDAFTQALTNPLLSKAVFNHPDTFSPEGRAIVDATSSLADIVARNTGITDRNAVGFKIRS